MNFQLLSNFSVLPLKESCHPEWWRENGGKSFLLAPFDFSWTDTLHLGVIQNYFNTIVNIEVPKVSETYSVRKDSFPGFLISFMDGPLQLFTVFIDGTVFMWKYAIYIDKKLASTAMYFTFFETSNLFLFGQERSRA